MKKVLSIVAVISAAAYLAAGIGLLAFQDMVKVSMGYQGLETVKVYPPQNVLQLVVMGIPCIVLGIVSLSESPQGGRGRNFLLIVYSALMLVLGELLASVTATVYTVYAGHMMGVDALASIGVLNSAFNGIRFLIHLSLVMLLLRGALEIGR